MFNLEENKKSYRSVSVDCGLPSAARAANRVLVR
jgi:hypothetical protein